MAFVKEIGRNGVLYSGIWPRHRVSSDNQNKEISGHPYKYVCPP